MQEYADLDSGCPFSLVSNGSKNSQFPTPRALATKYPEYRGTENKKGWSVEE